MRTTALWTMVILGQSLLYGSYSILVNLSKSDNQVPYLSSSLVLSTEILKLAICIGILWPQCKTRSLPTVAPVDVLLFSIPAICYTISNNLAFHMQNEMDPTTYMVLGNLKILSTALLYKWIMKSQISLPQWGLLCFLTISGIITSFAALDSKTYSLSETHLTLLGVFQLGCYCFISGFAGVYTEYKLKVRQELSVLHQNIFIYSYGVFFNFFVWTMQASHLESSYPYFLFSGYSWSAWILIITQATVGLAMSYILKYKGNLVRIFVISCGPVITGFLSYLIFNWQPHDLFVLGSFGMISSILLYNLEEKRKFWQA